MPDDNTLMPARHDGRRRALRALLPVAGVAIAALTLGACGSGGAASPDKTVTKTAGSPSAGSSDTNSSSTPTAPTSTAPPKKLVDVKTLNNDNAEYGVGMPVIAYFPHITSAKAWQAGTKATANGKPITVAWYFEPTSSGNGFYEAHLRPGPTDYWPAHASIHIQFPAKGTSLGGNMVADGKLSSLDFKTGPRNISVVNNATHHIVVTSDGKQKYNFPVSLGASNTPTYSGVKVIMEKGRDISMTGPGYYDPHVKYTQRLTYSGEYLHAAPWNTSNIENGVNSSNGCTNLEDQDAITLYNFLRVGDVVKYPNATGPRMTLGQGYGDYNLTWSQWQTGGAVPTT